MSEPESNDPTPSPLTEAEPESLSILFDRIDQKLIKNLPREITDLEIEQLVKYYVSERQRFIHDQSNFIKPTRGKSTGSGTVKKSLTEALKNAKFDF